MIGHTQRRNYSKVKALKNPIFGQAPFRLESFNGLFILI
jgi:hypothetical protein